MNCMNEGQSVPVSILHIALHGCLFLCTRLLVWLGKYILCLTAGLRNKKDAQWLQFTSALRLWNENPRLLLSIWCKESIPAESGLVSPGSARVCGCLRMEGPVLRFLASTQVCMHTRACWHVCPLFACALAAAERYASRGVNVEVWVYYRLGWAEPPLSGLSISATH